MGFLDRPREIWWRKALFQFHLWCGLVLGLYFVTVCLTGSLVVYKKELERLQIPQLIKVAPAAERGSFEAMVRLVERSYPGYQLQNAFLYEQPGISWSFRLQGREGRVQVYVDPYRIRILGHDSYRDKFLQWVYDLHTDLLMGKSGSILNGYGAFLLCGMCLSGIVVWWPGRRFWRNGLRWARQARWKRQNYDLHKLSGLASLLLLLLLAATGAYWSFPAEYEAAISWVTGGPAKRNPPPVHSHGAIPMASLDDVLRAARQAIPGGEATLFRFSQKPGSPHSLHQFLPGDWRTQGDNVAYVHPRTAAVLRVDYHRELPLGVRWQRDIYGLHFGTFWGHPTRVLWILVGIVPALLFTSGLLMYWNRLLSKRWSARRRSVPARTPYQPSDRKTFTLPGQTGSL